MNTKAVRIHGKMDLRLEDVILPAHAYAYLMSGPHCKFILGFLKVALRDN